MTTNNLEDSYGEDYLKWKNWDLGGFGNLKAIEAAYFKCEINRAGLTLPPKSKVLEIGFGNGSFFKYAKMKNWDICGTELNKALVEVAQSQGYDAIHTEDLSHFNDGTFDLVVAFDVLEHISQAYLVNILLEVNRILKTDGMFIARFPNGDSPFGLIYQNGDITHISAIGSKKIHYLSEKTNMPIVYMGGEAQPILCGNLLHFCHRIIAVPVKKIVNIFINFIYFPRTEVAFCSSNLIMVLKK